MKAGRDRQDRYLGILDQHGNRAWASHVRKLTAPLFFAVALVPITGQAAPAFSDEGPLSTDSGNVQLNWQADGPVVLELVGPAGEAMPLYQGTNDSFFLTGLHDGDYEVRLSDETGDTATIALGVAHQSLTRALWLVALGALVFLLTVGVILRGARDD